MGRENETHLDAQQLADKQLRNLDVFNKVFEKVFEQGDQIALTGAATVSQNLAIDPQPGVTDQSTYPTPPYEPLLPDRTTSDFLQEPNHDLRNKLFIEKAVALLPQYNPVGGKDYPNRFIPLKSVQEAKLVQAHTLWLSHRPHDVSCCPHYVVGDASHPDQPGTKPTTNLLIVSSRQDPGLYGLKIARVYNEDLKVWYLKRHKLLHSDYTQEDIDNLYSGTSLVMGYGKRSRPWCSQYAPAITELRRALHKGKNILRLCGDNEPTVIENGISDADLARFDVLDHLDSLCSTFGKEREFMNLASLKSQGNSYQDTHTAERALMSTLGRRFL